MQLLLRTKVLSLLVLHLAELVDLKSPLPELEVGLPVEVVVVRLLEDAIGDLALSCRRSPFCILAVLPFEFHLKNYVYVFLGSFQDPYGGEKNT